MPVVMQHTVYVMLLNFAYLEFGFGIFTWEPMMDLYRRRLGPFRWWKYCLVIDNYIRLCLWSSMTVDSLHLHSFIFVFDIQGMQSQRWPHLHSSLRGIPGIVSIPPCPESLDATVTDTHLHLNTAQSANQLLTRIVFKKHLFLFVVHLHSVIF